MVVGLSLAVVDETTELMVFTTFSAAFVTGAVDSVDGRSLEPYTTEPSLPLLTKSRK